MATTFAFKDIIDLPVWRPAATLPASATAGVSISYDKRNNERNAPYNYMLASATNLQAYLPANDGWQTVGSPALTGTFGAGAASIFHPSQGPRGTLAASTSDTVITLSTALPAAVGLNSLANNGSSEGFFIRVIDNAVGGTGQTVSRRIVANTAGTTPTIVLESTLGFTPATGSAYELRSGRVFMLSAGTLAAGMWKYYDVATNSFSGNLATANLPATIATDSCLVDLSEAYTPYDAATSTGFLGNITATASSATTITGSGLPATLQTSQYRNFQVRIITDTTTPTAAGQRRRISSHTSGASAVFTVAAWAVTPSATATFVVENDDDKIILFTNQTNVYNYNITANTWDTTTWAAAPAVGAAGVTAEQSFGIVIDAASPPNARTSNIFRFRGGAVTTVDVLDIAGAATGSWTTAATYGGSGTTFTTGTCGAYDPVTNQGRYLYLSVSGTAQFQRFDMLNRVLEPWTILRYTQGTAVVGRKLHMAFFIDGATKGAFLYSPRNSGTEHFSILCQR